MSLFFFGNNFYKNNETFKIFAPQILEVYRIPFVETTLESIMFYYTFSVINTMFVRCTALQYDSATATRTLKLFTALLIIFVESVFLFWWFPLLSVDCFHKLCLSGTPSENGHTGWDLGNRMARGYWFYGKWVCIMGSYAWGIQVFCSRKEVVTHFLNRTEHLNTSGITSHRTHSFRIKPITPGHPIPKISTCLFSEGATER